jgi:hypothetical protein
VWVKSSLGSKLTGECAFSERGAIQWRPREQKHLQRPCSVLERGMPDRIFARAERTRLCATRLCCSRRTGLKTEHRTIRAPSLLLVVRRIHIPGAVERIAANALEGDVAQSTRGRDRSESETVRPRTAGTQKCGLLPSPTTPLFSPCSVLLCYPGLSTDHDNVRSRSVEALRGHIRRLYSGSCADNLNRCL